jgi:hypothetical protein
MKKWATAGDAYDGRKKLDSYEKNRGRLKKERAKTKRNDEKQMGDVKSSKSDEKDEMNGLPGSCGSSGYIAAAR